MVMNSIIRYDKQQRKFIYGNKLLAYAIGVGIALFGIHSIWQPGLEQTAEGIKTTIILPQVGFIIILLSLAMLLSVSNYKPKLENKYLYIPLFVIVGSIAIRIAVQPGMDTVAALLFGLCMIGLFFAGKELGKDIFKVLMPFVVIEAISCIVAGTMNPGHTTGGIITNYCAAGGFMLMGTVLYEGKWKRHLIALVAVALFFTGSAEAVFVAISMIIYYLWKNRGRERRIKGLVLVAPMIAIALLWAIPGNTQELWAGHEGDGGHMGDRVESLKTVIARQFPVAQASEFDKVEGESDIDTLDFALTGRLEGYIDAVQKIAPFGHGYNPMDADARTVHNVPLIVVDQLGIVAAIAWLFISLYCWIKLKMRYAWTMLLALCVFDHFIWTQLAPIWWCLIGVSAGTMQKERR